MPDVREPERPRVPRITWLAGGAVLLLALVLMAVHASRRESDLIQTNGVPIKQGVVRLSRPGHLACETRIPLAEPARGVRLWAAVVGRPARAVTGVVRDSATRRALASDRVSVAEGGPRIVDFELSATVASPRLVDVCVRLDSPAALDLWGSTPTTRGRRADRVVPEQQQLIFRDAVPLPGDVRIDLRRAQPTSLLERLPQAFVKAGTFKPWGIGAWTWWLFLALALLAAPALLAVALATAARRSHDASPPR